MKSIYIIKYDLSVASLYAMYTGDIHSPASAFGYRNLRENARKLVDEHLDLKPSCFVCSPLEQSARTLGAFMDAIFMNADSNAHVTAFDRHYNLCDAIGDYDAAEGKTDVEVAYVADKRITARNYGVLTCTPYVNPDMGIDRQLHERIMREYIAPFEGMEGFEDMLKRADSFTKELVSLMPEDTCAIVSGHGDINKFLVYSLTHDESAFDLFEESQCAERVDIEGGSITHSTLLFGQDEEPRE